MWETPASHSDNPVNRPCHLAADFVWQHRWVLLLQNPGDRLGFDVFELQEALAGFPRTVKIKRGMAATVRCAVVSGTSTPTPKALRWGLDSLALRTAAGSWVPLVRLMLPRSGRKPLTLGDGTIPKWLPHQHEVNHLVTSIATSAGRRVLWVSSWDCPFPNRAGMPQPDYVLVEERG